VARRQRTIENEAELHGSGLFSGQSVTVRLLPAETSTGYLFVRTDLPDSPVVPATTEAVADGFRCTTLNWNEVEVKAIEHVLAAAAGLQVDNLIIELDGDELPALDGCPMEYAEALLDAGIVEQSEERPVLKLEDTITVPRGDAALVAMPGDDEELIVSYVLDYEEGYGPSEACTLSLTPETFLKELAPARTFGLEEDYDQFRQLALGGGITDDNAFVRFRDGTVRKPLSGEPAELRFPDESARHKVVDLIGDMALAGVDLKAKIVAFRSGHRLNTAFAARLRRLLEEEAGPAQFLDVREILRILPHRYPFLMVDRIVKVEGENKIIGLKNVSVNEPYFQGHYPDQPIMPGVLQIEALAQTAGMLCLRKLEHTGKVPLLVSMNDVKLRRAVLPGDQLVLEAETVRTRPRMAVVRARGTVNDEVACQAEMTFMLADSDAL
jgi:UDP-3-O-[3-hydroxymyristoyl] N-acetylglucosamine deacetylase/3-hydroxyacyl-[acyl-carrier-protein] dehydratase